MCWAAYFLDAHITAMENNANLTAVSRRCSAAFTGHRSFPYGETADVKAALTELIKKWHGEGVTNYLCGMALGFDLMAAECVLQAKGISTTSRSLPSYHTETNVGCGAGVTANATMPSCGRRISAYC